MKKVLVLAIALVAVGMTAVSAQTNYSTAGWPPANILKQFGIEGIPQPTGAREATWRGDWAEIHELARALTRGNPALLISFRGTNATGTAIKNWFERNGWNQTDSRKNGAGYRKGNSVAYYDYTSENTGQIVAGVLPETGRNSVLYGTWRNPSNGRTLIFSEDGWEWVEMIGGEYTYDGTTLALNYDGSPATVQVTISGDTLTIGTFSGNYASDFNNGLRGAYKKVP
jgi:hypothetical protein